VATDRTGLVAGITAYLLWGLITLYWPLLDPAAPIEVLAHRIAWSLVVVGVLLAATRRFRRALALDRRRAALLALAALLIAVNWGTFIAAVTSDQVVETSLGYFINPLVTVALGVVVLGERLRRAQWAAFVLAAVAVVVLTVDVGRPPWIALVLASTFALYGLLKKRADVEPLESLAFETVVLVVPAVGYLAVLGATGDGTFTTEGPGHAALLAGAGLATALPLVAFGAAAVRIPLTTIGLLQYLAPTIQFFIGVVVLSEPMPASRLAGFVLVWAALVVFSADGLREARRRRRAPAPGTVARALPAGLAPSRR
jgi:chloramphenicol-sensitive protein RarD